MIEFADFECPFCASFNTDFAKLKRKYGADISLTFVHYPLPNHRFALPAARAAECAGEQGRFNEMHGSLFKRQTEFGVTSWERLAGDVGVNDLASFNACMIRSKLPVKVRAGRKLAETLKIAATPTVIVNGWQLPPSTGDDMEKSIEEILNGKKITPK